MKRDEAVERFLRRHARDPRRAVADDVAPYVGRSAAETWLEAAALCRGRADLATSRPDWRELLMARDPPHPSLRGIVARLRRERSARDAG